MTKVKLLSDDRWFWRSLWAVWLQGIYMYPLLVVTGLYSGTRLPFILLMVHGGAGLLGVLVRRRYMGTRRKAWLRLGASFVMGMLAMVVALPFSLSLLDLVSVAVWGAFAAYMGLTPEPELRSTLSWRLQMFGVAGAIVASAVSSLEPFRVLQAYNNTLYVSGGISFVAWLLGIYFAQLDRAMLNDGNRRMVLKEFVRANHVRLLLLLIVIGAIGAFPSLAAWLAPLRDRLLAWIRSLLGSSSSSEPPPPPSAANEPLMFPGEAEGSPGEPSMLWNILGWAVLGFVAVVIVWLVVRLGKRVFIKWVERFKRWLEPGESKKEPITAYMDVSESLQMPAKKRKQWFRKKDSLPSEDGERVRYYYGHWIRNAKRLGVRLPDSSTPLEAAEVIGRERGTHKWEAGKLTEVLPHAYNEVRYGNKVPDHEALREIDRIWKSERAK